MGFNSGFKGLNKSRVSHCLDLSGVRRNTVEQVPKAAVTTTVINRPLKERQITGD